MKQWERVKRVSSHDFGFYSVVVDAVTTPGGKPGHYSVVQTKPAVVIVPQTDDGRVHLVKQHRYTTGEFSIEFPKGGTDGEEPLRAAIRELEEECQLEAYNWRHVGMSRAANGIMNARCEIFLATGLATVQHPVKDPLDEGLIENLVLPIDLVAAMIRRGEIVDEHTLAAFLHVYCLEGFKMSK